MLISLTSDSKKSFRDAASHVARFSCIYDLHNSAKRLYDSSLLLRNRVDSLVRVNETWSYLRTERFNHSVKVIQDCLDCGFFTGLFYELTIFYFYVSVYSVDNKQTLLCKLTYKFDY